MPSPPRANDGNDRSLRRLHIRLTLGLWAFLAVLLALIIVGQVDVATTGVGRVIPDDQVKVIQSFEAGIVTEIAVRDGDRVAADTVLIRLDTKDALADQRRMATDLAVARVEFARLKATIDYDREEPFNPPPGSPQYAVEMSEYLMRNQISEITALIAQIDSDIREKEAALTVISVLIKKNTDLLPLMQQRENMHSQLLKTQATSKIAYLDEQERLIRTRSDLAEQERRLIETTASLESLRDRRRNTILRFRSDRLTEIVETQRKMLSLEQDHAKAQERLRRHTIVSPIDGTVQDQAVYTIGAVVNSNESLMVIVPTSSKLIVEGFIPNKDSGFVQVGQKVELKVTTFDYRRYGIATGTVMTVSRDAIKGENTRNLIAPTKTQTERLSELKKLNPALEEGPIFRVEIALAKATMNIDGRDTPLTAGMALEMNILTSRRRIVEFFLAPFQTYQDQAFRQR